MLGMFVLVFNIFFVIGMCSAVLPLTIMSGSSPRKFLTDTKSNSHDQLPRMSCRRL